MPSIETARQWYAEVDAVHDFDHVLRVYRMAEHLAKEEGADLGIVRAAALLHDARGTAPGSQARMEHHLASALFAAEVLAAEGWRSARIEAVQHCIRSHRFRAEDEPPQTIEAKIIFDADKLDVLGAVGVARVVQYATLAGQPVFSEPSAQFLATGKEAPGEPHSAYHEHLFKLSKVRERLFTDAAKRMADERHAYLEGYFQRLQQEWYGEK
ncbi:MAG: HD domain-containing protein [Anaerolineae bacterium]|nr:HD domain-containing protein [Anaerolineae bacterium]